MQFFLFLSWFTQIYKSQYHDWNHLGHWAFTTEVAGSNLWIDQYLVLFELLLHHLCLVDLEFLWGQQALHVCDPLQQGLHRLEIRPRGRFILRVCQLLLPFVCNYTKIVAKIITVASLRYPTCCLSSYKIVPVEGKRIRYRYLLRLDTDDGFHSSQKLI